MRRGGLYRGEGLSSKSDGRPCVVAPSYYLSLTVPLDILKRRLFSRHDVVDGTLTCNVLYLSAREVVAHCQPMCLLVGDALHHAAPQKLLHRYLRYMELHLEEEPPLEGFVEVGSQIGRSDEYAVQVLHFLKDDVLHGVVHLVNGACRMSRPVRLAICSTVSVLPVPGAP